MGARPVSFHVSFHVEPYLPEALRGLFNGHPGELRSQVPGVVTSIDPRSKGLGTSHVLPSGYLT